MGVSKNIDAKNVVPYAMEYFKWVDGDDGPEDPAKVREALLKRFGP